MDGRPNVRIVNFYFEPEKKRCTFPALQIIKRWRNWSKNPHVAFTTITDNGEEHVRVKDGMIYKSSGSVVEIKAKFLTKLLEYIMSIPDVIPALILFEITFCNAEGVLDFEHMDTITL